MAAKKKTAKKVAKKKTAGRQAVEKKAAGSAAVKKSVRKAAGGKKEASSATRKGGGNRGSVKGSSGSARGVDVGNLTGRAVAQLFGVTPQAVGLWHKNQGCPRKQNNRYELAEVISWRLDYERAQVAGESQATRDKEESLARKAAADAELRELQLKREKALIVDKAVMEQREIVIATRFRKWLEDLPRTLDITPEIRAILECEFKRALIEFAQQGLKGWSGKAGE